MNERVAYYKAVDNIVNNVDNLTINQQDIQLTA